MSSINTPQKTAQGWVVDIPSEIAKSLGVAEGSIAVLHVKDGQLETEILPPLSDDLNLIVDETIEEYKEAFEEMKRLGD